MTLTAKKIELAKPGDKNYKLFDQEGLHLLIRPTGTKSWVLKYYFEGKEKKITLGQYPLISLKEARERKSEFKLSIARGIDPIQKQKQEKAEKDKLLNNTFEKVAQDWFETMKDEWKAKHAQKVWRRLEIHALPKLGKVPIDQIKQPEIISVIRPIEQKGTTDVSRRVFQTCSAILRHGVNTGKIMYNPAAEMGNTLKKHKSRNYPRIPFSELKQFCKDLDEVDTSLQNKLCIKILMHTFPRTGELRLTKWEHIDFKNSVWKIPAEIMKMSRPHRIPLTPQTLSLFKQLKQVTQHCPYGYIAPTQQRRKNPTISDGTINQVIHKMGYKGRMVGHGFRGIASTTLNEKQYDPRVIEAQLAHQEESAIVRAYNHADYWDKRVEMMHDWSNIISKEINQD